MKKLFIIVILAALRAGAAEQFTYDIAEGPYQGTEEALMASDYQCPEWFRDAKFGIWAHWGPQAVPGIGDWFARHMYISDGKRYEKLYKDNPEGWMLGHWKSNLGGNEERSGKKSSDYFRKHYGHQSEVGFKDLCHEWKAENLDTDKLLAAYKKAGAKYFTIIGHHHDNFDLWDSKFHEWNSVRVGPNKDIVGMFRKSTKDAGLHFGVSLHPHYAHWFAPSRVMSDASGPYKDIPYDGAQTKADGKGKWWEGMDPQKLYGRAGSERGKYTPSERHNYFLRSKDLIDNYEPDLLYFDNGVLPREEAGPYIAAHYYNSSIKKHGSNQAVLNIKSLRNYFIADRERGVSSQKQPWPWQTDTCIGSWFYTRPGVRRYKTSDTIIKNLVDIVSKNGNLLLSVPFPASGELDERATSFLKEMGAWMDVNSEGIHGTRPWAVFGEAKEHKTVASSQHNDSKLKYGADEFRFTHKGDDIYAFAMGWPKNKAVIKALGKNSPFIAGNVKKVTLLGHRELPFVQGDESLMIQTPQTPVGEHVFCFKIEGLKTRDDRAICSIYYAEEDSSMLSPGESAYRFDALKYGPLAGQDGFEITQEKGAVRIIPVDAAQKNRRVGIAAPGTISRTNGGTWNIPTFTGDETNASITFDVFNSAYSLITINLSGKQSASPSVGILSGAVALKTGAADVIREQKPSKDCRNRWFRIKAVMNFQKNTVSAFAMNLSDGETTFKPLDKLQDIDMELEKGAAAKWDTVNITLERQLGEINEVLIDHIEILK